MDLHVFLFIAFIDFDGNPLHFRRLSWIQANRILYCCIAFHRFSWISGLGCLKLGTTLSLRPATPIEDFARFQAGFLSWGLFMDFHRCVLIFQDFYAISGYGCYVGVLRPAAYIETFVRFQAGFLSSEDSSYFIDFHGLLVGWLAARLASEMAGSLPARPPAARPPARQ